MNVANAILEPLQYAFFVRALMGVSLVALLCALVGAFVVLRGLSYLGDAMAHAVFPGVVGAFLLQINYFVGAGLAAVVTALGVSAITNRSRLRQDAAIGIVFVGMFALGVAMLSRTRTYQLDLAHFLIGNPLGLGNNDLIVTASVTLVVAALLWMFEKELLLVSFDPTEAQVIGLPVAHLNTFLLVLVALVVVIAIQMVGTVLVVSMLVTASASARLLTRKLRHMMALSAAFGMLAGIAGLYASYHLELAPGASIVIANTIIFVVALLLHRRE